MPRHINLGKPLTEATLAEIRIALSRHLVIAFEAQRGFTPEMHRELALSLGDGAARASKLHSSIAAKSSEDPELQGLIRFSRESHPSFGFDWHSDMSFNSSPRRVSLAHCGVRLSLAML